LARPTPYSWSIGDIIATAILNGIRDALTWSQNPPDFIGIQGTTVQSIGNSAWTALNLDTNTLDSYSGHSTTSNTSRYVCQAGTAGWYTCGGVFAAAANSTANRGGRLQVNGSPIEGAAAFAAAAGTGNATGVVTPTRDIYLNVGDYLELAAWQGSGGALNTAIFSDITTALWARFSHA
jgi:hypothetical protein